MQACGAAFPTRASAAASVSIQPSHVHCRFQKESKEHKAIQKELDAANERFKEYERKDVKLREDVKHLSAKQKKLLDKLAKDTTKAEVKCQSSYIAPTAYSWLYMSPQSMIGLLDRL